MKRHKPVSSQPPNLEAASPTERRLLALISEAGLLRPRDLEAHGIAREHLRRLEARELVVRFARGLYCLPDADLGENESLAAACKLVPGAVVCLLSALRFHQLTTQSPRSIWLAIHTKAAAPAPGRLPLRLVRSSTAVLEAGVDQHLIAGVPVRIYNPAKTVADCFKHRNKIGIDIALEALRDFRRKKNCSIDELSHYAEICRVSKVLQPYLEALG